MAPISSKTIFSPEDHQILLNILITQTKTLSSHSVVIDGVGGLRLSLVPESVTIRELDIHAQTPEMIEIRRRLASPAEWEDIGTIEVSEDDFTTK
jgi:hypothetical protein